jgi:hypothetical protein
VLDSDFLTGGTGVCGTFNNPPLTSQSSQSPEPPSLVGSESSRKSVKNNNLFTAHLSLSRENTDTFQVVNVEVWGFSSAMNRTDKRDPSVRTSTSALGSFDSRKYR